MLVPSFIWSISALVLLAIMSTLAVPADARPAWPSLEHTEQLMEVAWKRAEHRYAAEVFEIIARRLREFRDNNRGYGDIGVYVEELVSGFSIGYDAERLKMDVRGEYAGYYHTASVAKLVMAYTFYRLDDLGEVDKEAWHMDPVVRQRYQFRPMIHRMITNSLNLHYNVLLRYLGWERVYETLMSLELRHTRLSRELGWAPGTSDAT